MKEYWLYLIRCSDNSLYCGIALDVTERFKKHCNGKGAKYTKGRGPLALVYQEKIGSHGDALRKEREVKKMNKSEKENLISQH